MSTAAGIYCRISRDPGATQLGVTRQRQDCEALAERKRWKVTATYVDDDESAYDGKRRSQPERTGGRRRRVSRPQYRRMLDDLRSGRINAVVVWHPDRLHRSPRELEDFIDLIESTGAKIATCTAGDYDLSTPDGRLLARITGSVARKESEDKSRRLRRKHEELATLGKISGGGIRPFGYDDDRRSIRPTEAKLIRQAARRVLAGDSLYSIVGDWTVKGVATATGVPWSTTSLKSSLVRGRIAGLRERHGEVVAKADWPAILPEAQWRQVRAVLLDPQRRRNPVVRSYLLTGMLQCELCRATMVATPRAGARPGASVRAYGCHRPSGGCGHVYGLAEPIEKHVAGWVFDMVDSSALAKTRRPYDDGPIAEAVAADEAQLMELADAWVDRKIGRAEWLRSRERIEARLAGWRRQMKPQPADVFDGVSDVRKAWPALSLDRKRLIIQEVFEWIRLGPATGARNRFNPERLSHRARV